MATQLNGAASKDAIDYKNESKRDKFLRLAESRTNAVLGRIRTLSKCSNPYAYEYTEEDVKEIFSAIEEELRVAKAQFRTPRSMGKFQLRTETHE